LTEHAPIAEVRSELKWRLDVNKQHYVFALLAENGFKNLHPVRRIFSLYYDYPNFHFFQQGEEGVVPRSKLRIRCYQSAERLADSGRIEIKTTGMSGRTKYSLSRNESAARHLPAYLRQIYQHYLSGVLRPVTMVNYQRRYFSNNDGYRATIDTGIEYSRVVRFDSGRLIKTAAIRDPYSVLELKTPMRTAPLDFGDNLPLTRMRFSKYNESLLRTESQGGLGFQRR
jgi:hypothetical protein